MTDKSKNIHGRKWRGFHKWVGLAICILMPVFCVSGIILNHRDAVRGMGVPRGLMPSAYHLKDYNNGIVRGTLSAGADSLLMFGNAGVWLTDSSFARHADFNEGIDEGPDNRAVRNIVRTRDGRLWCATQYALYVRGCGRWHKADLPHLRGRITDIALPPDSLAPVVLTRSGIYTPARGAYAYRELAAPEGYTGRVSLFRTVWQLHSGELFGLGGRIAVDAIALIVIVLCITGLVVFVMPYAIRRSAAARIKSRAAALKWDLRQHNTIGLWTIVLTLIVAATGMCLRPPLMIPLVLTKTAPLPGSAMDSDNPWHDKLRALRFDSATGEWILSTSEGFYLMDATLDGTPRAAAVQPPVSPMGVNVFEKNADGEWLVGSFSGLYRWDRADAKVLDAFTGEPYTRPAGGPVGSRLVSGYSPHLAGGTVFDYATGAEGLPPMPDVLREQKMSLWNFALELHVGRCYTPLLGPFSELFVFVAGLMAVLVLVSGLILNRRMARRMARRKKTRK